MKISVCVKAGFYWSGSRFSGMCVCCFPMAQLCLPTFRGQINLQVLWNRLQSAQLFCKLLKVQHYHGKSQYFSSGFPFLFKESCLAFAFHPVGKRSSFVGFSCRKVKRVKQSRNGSYNKSFFYTLKIHSHIIFETIHSVIIHTSSVFKFMDISAFSVT